MRGCHVIAVTSTAVLSRSVRSLCILLFCVCSSGGMERWRKSKSARGGQGTDRQYRGGGGGAYYRPASYGGEYPATYLLAPPTRGFVC